MYDINFLNQTDDTVLKRLFYKCKQRFYEPGQVLFNLGEYCEDIFIILSGIIDI